MAKPDITVKFWDGSALTDFAESCTRIQIRRGKQRVLDRMTASSCVLEFIDTTGDLDPATGNNPFGPDTFVVIEATKTNAADPEIFVGRVDSWQVSYPGPDYAVVAVAASGQLKQLSQVELSVTLSTNVEDALDEVVAFAFDAVADGTYVVYADYFGQRTGDEVALTSASGSSLSLAQALCETHGGDLVERYSDDRTHPIFQFIARRRRYQNPVITFTDVQADLDPENGIYPYNENSYVSAATDDLIRNRATVTRQGGAAQTAEDAASLDVQDGHGPREYSLSSYHTSDALALIEAGRIVWENANPPSVSVASIQLEPSAEDDDDLWDFVIDIGLEAINVDGFPLMRQATVVRTTPFGTIERNCILVGYQHDIYPQAEGAWTTTLFFADGHLYTGGDVTAFTGVVKQNGSTVASTTDDAYYETSNGFTTAHFKASITAAGTNNTELKVTPSGLPAPASADAGEACGVFRYFDSGAANYFGYVDWDGTDLRLSVHNNGGVWLGQTPTFAAANGDKVYVSIRYRNA